MVGRQIIRFSWCTTNKRVALRLATRVRASLVHVCLGALSEGLALGAFSELHGPIESL